MSPQMSWQKNVKGKSQMCAVNFNKIYIGIFFFNRDWKKVKELTS